jgi:drug/metabolite transporter (DMT)-like permease
VVVLGALTVSGNYAIERALTDLHAGVVSSVLQTQVLVVALMEVAFLGARMRARFWVGALVAVGGFAVMRAPIGADAGVSLAGLIWVLVAATSFSAMLVFTRWIIERIDPVFVNASRLVLACLVMAAIPEFRGGLSASATSWGFAAAAAFCGPFASRLCLMFAVRHITASHTKLITLSSPIFAFLFAGLAMMSMPSARELIGSLLLVGGICVPIADLLRSRQGNS